MCAPTSIRSRIVRPSVAKIRDLVDFHHPRNADDLDFVQRLIAPDAHTHLATIDVEGYCNITGRVKDMLIRGGENVYPREIEEYLYRHPAVQQVQVFGVPDPRYGEEICAWIIPQPGEAVTEEEIKAFCQGQIAHYKVPRYVRIRTELPMTVTGKAQKFKMRDAMIEELGLSVEDTA